MRAKSFIAGKAHSSKRMMLIAIIIFFDILTIQGQTNNRQCQQIKSLLTTISNRVSDENKVLSKLFQIGDDCIDDLVSNLNGSDFQISVAAQEVIRYLGNEKGLRALEDWNKKNKNPYLVRGPVPIPIMEFDYVMIDIYVLGEDKRDLGLVNSPYIYALAIDKYSPKSKILFQKMLKRLESVDKGSITKRIVDRVKTNYPLKPFSVMKNIETTVRENAFFLSEEDKEFTTAKLLSFNGKKDKALVELHISRGIFAEEWYHVVVRKVRNAWEFFSIKFIKQS